MPKRYGNLFDQCFTFDNLYFAYLDARKSKRSKPSVKSYEADLGYNLVTLHKRIHDFEYQPDEYQTFYISDPKTRLVHAPSFQDRIVQHAIYRIVYPIFDKSFIFDSYGCRKGKGIHTASHRAQNYLRKSSPNSYALQIDIRRFYASINHVILQNQLESKIKDKNLIDMMMTFVKSTHTEQYGLPIGNLLSQLYGLVYLNQFDHFVKRDLKVKFYTRYVDDSVLYDIESKELANHILHEIQVWLKNTLLLELSKYKIIKSSSPIPLNFVGYRMTRQTRRVRTHSIRNFHRALMNPLAHHKLPSFLGHAKNSSTLKFYYSQISFIDK